MREMGRRSEAADHPFRAMKPDEGGARGPRPSPRANTRQPLVLITSAAQREIIYAACPEAQALGLRPGMAVAQARACVPDLEVQPADAERDALLLQRFLHHAVRYWTPSAASDGRDGIWLDLHGTTHLFGGERRFCEQVLRFFARLGYTARIALADSSGAAHGLARYATSSLTIVPSGKTVEAIAPLPIEALRLSSDMAARARRFGIERVGDMLGMPRAPLAKRLGQDALLRLDQAIGREVEQIAPVRIAEPSLVARQLVEPIATAEAIGHVIGRLAEDLCTLLADRGIGARRLRMSFRRVDNDEQTILLGTARATRDARHLTRLFQLQIETIDPGLGIESAQLLAERVEPLAAIQEAVTFLGGLSNEDLAPLVDQLSGRVGEHAVFRAAPVESDVPERAVARVSPLDRTGRWSTWRRPVRLLHRPERLTHVVALLPDHPPRRFTWRGESHVVVAGDGPERIHGEWWVRDGELWAVRDYFRIEDTKGHHYWLFRRGDGDDASTGDFSWWMHGVG